MKDDYEYEHRCAEYEYEVRVSYSYSYSYSYSSSGGVRSHGYLLLRYGVAGKEHNRESFERIENGDV